MLILLQIIAHTSLSIAAIIGPDNMVDYADLDKKSISHLAQATATQLNTSYLKTDFIYPNGSLKNFCPGERFQGRKTLGGCSGFLIAPDILVTAGHCAKYQENACSTDAWLFSHYSEENFQPNLGFQLKKENIFYCKEVLDYRHDGEGDYAVLRLDRPAPSSRKPFTPSLGEDLQWNDPLSVLGYPLGLTFIYSPGGNIKKLDKILETTLDVHSKNSGSVVLNERTGLAEGIITNGSSGLRINPIDGCWETNYEATGTTYVNRLSEIPYIKEHFPAKPLYRNIEIQNNCSLATHNVMKFRDRENKFRTISFDLAKGEKKQIETKGSVFLFAKDQSENTIVSGKDFWGFEDSSHTEELGFKEFSIDRIILCP